MSLAAFDRFTEEFRRGDVVMVLLPRIVEWWVINVACLRMGAVISPAPKPDRGRRCRQRRPRQRPRQRRQQRRHNPAIEPFSKAAVHRLLSTGVA